MTDLRKAASMALDALENTARSAVEQYVIEQHAVEALRQALAHDEQEPVAWLYDRDLHSFDPTDWAIEPESVQPLYTAPVKQTPVAWRKKANGVWHYFDESTPFPFDDCEPLYEKN